MYYLRSPDVDAGPWLDADADLCGDITAGTQVFKTTPSLRVACMDTNGNGIVDASVCTSWDNNALTNCASVAEAFPGNNAKCGCARVELGIPMGSGTPVPALPGAWLPALALLLAAGGFILLRRRRAGAR